jgi:hypothetical protein
MRNVYNVMISEHEDSDVNRLTGILKTEFNKNPVTGIGMFVNETGGDLGESFIVGRGTKNVGVFGKADFGSKNLNQYILEQTKEGNTVETDVMMHSPDINGGGVNYVLEVKTYTGTGAGKKEVVENRILIPKVKLNQNHKHLDTEVAVGMLTEHSNAYTKTSPYKNQQISRAKITLGQERASKEPGSNVDDLTKIIAGLKQVNSKDRAITQMTTFTDLNGSVLPIGIKKDIEGKYSLILPTGKLLLTSSGNEFKTSDPNAIQAIAYEQMGEITYILNPKNPIEVQRIPRATYSNNTSYNDYGFSKRDFSTTVVDEEE